MKEVRPLANRYLDFLADLAIDSAHPGGLRMTEALVGRLPIRAGDRILDVGCGTGATALFLARTCDAEVVGIDLHPKMVVRAKQRSEASGSLFQVIEGTAEKMPFSDHSFDWVFSESVTAFTDCGLSLHEYARVLKPGGRLAAIEMTLEKPIGEAEAAAIRRVYGVRQLLTEAGWNDALQKAGFSDVIFERLQSKQNVQDLVTLPIFDPSRPIDEEVLDIWLLHMQTLQTFKDVLTYRVFQATVALVAT